METRNFQRIGAFEKSIGGQLPGPSPVLGRPVKRQRHPSYRRKVISVLIFAFVFGQFKVLRMAGLMCDGTLEELIAWAPDGPVSTSQRWSGGIEYDEKHSNPSSTADLTGDSSSFYMHTVQSGAHRGMGSIILCALQFGLFHEKVNNRNLIVDERQTTVYRWNSTHGLFKGFFQKSFETVDEGKPGPLEGHIVYLRGKKSNKYLDGRNQNHEFVWMNANPTRNYGEWEVEMISEGIYAFKSVSSGKYLDGGSDPRTYHDGVIRISNFNPETDERIQWRVSSEGEDDYTLRNVASNLFLDARGPDQEEDQLWLSEHRSNDRSFFLVTIQAVEISSKSPSLKELISRNKTCNIWTSMQRDTGEKRKCHTVYGGAGPSNVPDYNDMKKLDIMHSYFGGSLYDVMVPYTCMQLPGLSAEAQESINMVVGNASLPVASNFEVAFHVRRTDKNTEMPHTDVSEYIQLYKRVDPVGSSKAKNCFVATDDPAVVEEMKESLASNGMHCKLWTLSTSLQTTLGGARNEIENIILLFAELQILVRAQKFVGTFGSNLGRLVSLFRGCPSWRTPTDESDEGRYYHSYSVANLTGFPW